MKSSFKSFERTFQTMERTFKSTGRTFKSFERKKYRVCLPFPCLLRFSCEPTQGKKIAEREEKNEEEAALTSCFRMLKPLFYEKDQISDLQVIFHSYISTTQVVNERGAIESGRKAPSMVSTKERSVRSSVR